MSRVALICNFEPTERAPYIYFIRKDRFLYIGETQGCPVIRWGSHLSLNGSFRNALYQADQEIAARTDLTLSFGCWRLDGVVANCSATATRRSTQFIEHMVHVLVLCNPTIGPKFEIISDTTRTAPIRTEYVHANLDAEAILLDLVRCLVPRS